MSRKTQRFNHCETSIVGALTALARTRQCQVFMDGNEISIVHHDRATRIGAIDDIHGMTLKSLIDIFEEARKD